MDNLINTDPVIEARLRRLINRLPQVDEFVGPSKLLKKKKTVL